MFVFAASACVIRVWRISGKTWSRAEPYELGDNYYPRDRGGILIEPAPSGKGQVLAQQSILVVEDEVLIRLHVAEELRDAGYTVVEAASGDEAITLLSSLNDIGIVLTDIRMPGNVDGLALAKWTRATFPSIRIVLISTEIHADSLQECDACFTKPVRLDELLRCVQKFMPPAERSGSPSR